MLCMYKEAKKAQISSFNHLLNTQELINQDKKFNPNFGAQNTLITYNPLTKKLESSKYVRNSNNQELITQISTLEQQLDAKARLAYKTHKEQERATEKILATQENRKPKKIRTVLQSKDLKKEFLITFGDGNGTLTRAEQLKQLPDLEERALDGIKAIFEAKGLTLAENLLFVAVHYDEKNLIHFHCQHTDYSYKNHTTGSELNRIRVGDFVEDVEVKTKKQAYALQRQYFSGFQDILANAIGLDRGIINSRKMSLSVQEYRKKQLLKEIEEEQQALNNLNLQVIQKSNNLAQAKLVKIIEDNKINNTVNLKYKHLENVALKLSEVNTQKLDNVISKIEMEHKITISNSKKLLYKLEATTSKNELLDVFCSVVEGFHEVYNKITALLKIKHSKQRIIERELTI